MSAALPPRFGAYLAGLRHNTESPRMLHYPGLSARPWYDAAQFPFARALEREAPHIIEEVGRLGHGVFHRETERIGRIGDWDVLFLYDRGRRHRENCAACPATVAVVEAHRTVRSLAGLVYFSRLAARTRVARHCGPTNLRLRCHLALDVPPDCGIAVAGESRTWTAGKCMVFDDSFPHEVWNASDRDRTVLVVDFWHPELTDDEVALLEGLHRYAAAHGRQMQRSWELNDQAERESIHDDDRRLRNGPARLPGAARSG